MRTSSPIRLSLATARTLAVVKQGLHRRPPTADKQALLETVRRIGLLQLDTISVVARSHYLVMLSRVGLYDPADLDALLYPGRQLFEQWAHAACLIPVEDYPHIAPTIQARRNRRGDDFRAALIGGFAPPTRRPRSAPGPGLGRALGSRHCWTPFPFSALPCRLSEVRHTRKERPAP